MKLRSKLQVFLANEAGATAIEYALLASLVAMACLLGIAAFGDGLVSLFGAVSSKAGGSLGGASGQL